MVEKGVAPAGKASGLTLAFVRAAGKDGGGARASSRGARVLSAADLRRQSSYLRRLIEAIPEAIVVSAADGRIRQANARTEALFGYTRRQLAGRSILSLLPERCHPGVANLWEEACRLGSLQWLSRDQGYAGLSQDRHEFPLELGLNPMTGARGETFLVASFRDVGAQVRAEQARIEAEQRYRAVLDQTFGAIGLLSTDGVVLEANKTALAMFGLTRDEVVGRKIWDSPWWKWDEASIEEAHRALERAAGGEVVRLEVTNREADGNTREFDFSLSRVFDAEGRVGLIIPEGRDLTDFLRARQQIQEQQASMALAEEVGRLKDQFLSAVSHEMRTPLSVIIGNAEFLQDQHPDAGPIDEILAGALRLARQIDNILEYSALLAGNLRLFPTDVSLTEVFRLVQAEVAKDFAASGVNLALDLPAEPPFLVADAFRLSRMLQLLLDNGRRFAPAGGTVGIRAGTEGDRVVLEVWDTGPGIPPGLAERVFEPFFQGDVDESARRGGLGLGLTIARMLAELQGWQLVCGQTPEGRNRCAIHIPQDPPGPPQTPGSHPGSSRPAPPSTPGGALG